MNPFHIFEDVKEIQYLSQWYLEKNGENPEKLPLFCWSFLLRSLTPRIYPVTLWGSPASACESLSQAIFCRPSYILIVRWKPHTNLSLTAGRLSYDVNPERKELSVSVSDMLEDHNYHLRLCRKDFICLGTGASSLVSSYIYWTLKNRMSALVVKY